MLPPAPERGGRGFKSSSSSTSPKKAADSVDAEDDESDLKDMDIPMAMGEEDDDLEGLPAEHDSELKPPEIDPAA